MLAWIVVYGAGMDWPQQRVEAIPPERFWPPHCPQPTCPSHRTTPRGFHRHGVFVRDCDQRAVPRFRCLDCKMTCSQQTFAASYYLKRPELLERVAKGINACSAHRQIGRSEECAHSTVTRLTARLGRHSLLLQALALEHLPPISEGLVYDDFESFVYSQDHPYGMGTAVGRESRFVYALELAPHKPTGPRAGNACGPEHRKKGPYRKAFARMLDLLIPRAAPQRRLELVTDGHKAYTAALANHPLRERVRHRVHRNPERGPEGSEKSPAAEARDAAMRPLDALHRLIRHSLSHHRRETIAFGRRLNAAMEHGFLMTTWRNFVKEYSEREPDGTSAAMRLGLTEERWSWRRVLARRLFSWRLRVPEPWMRIYRRELVTTAIGRNRKHALLRAF